ncbi:MAG: aldehyde dehydrogenase family protein [Candidatus Hydrogenedentes bacterium]|nr:aldehyde dehydrogenase family protein [Candidatus Hydrogenedentota bacterium]
MSEIAVKNPMTGEVLYVVPEADDAVIRHTFEAARRAFARISAMTVRERVAETLKIRDYILAHREAIIDKIVAETGKCRTDALTSEIFVILDVIDYYRKNAEKILAVQRVSTPFVLFGKKSRICFEPLGTVLVISPWNYPLHLALVPCITAFVAGNAVVFKPSEYTPLRGLVEEILEGSGFLRHGIQVVYGGKDVGAKLIDAKPAKILFTGSVRSGRKVMELASRHLIPVELELGGKDPMVVFEDVNLERTVNGALWGALTNCGQACTSVERIYVQEGLYDQFVVKLREKIEKVTYPGHGGELPDAGSLDVGCITPAFQLDVIRAHLDEARQNGAKILTGGVPMNGSHVVPPTMVVDVDPSLKLAAEETFGPVVTVMKFKTEEEAVKLANDSEYGLSASVWSGDLERGWRVARQIEAGNVNVNNVMITEGNSALPFGGVKNSGFGRYKGPFGLHAFSNIKSVMVDKQGSRIESNWFPYTKEKYQAFSKLIELLYGGGPLGFLKALVWGLRLELLTRRQRL